MKGRGDFPHREFISLVRKGDRLKIENRLMSASDKELAMALYYLGETERLYVLSLLSDAKSRRVNAVLERGFRFGREEYLKSVGHLIDHIKGEKPLTSLKSYYRPRREGDS